MLDQGINQAQKFGQFILHDIPDHVEIKLVVFMNNHVAHSGDFTPGNFGMGVTEGG
jgi:hypothetical protein